MKFVSGVFYDEVTPKIAENATHTDGMHEVRERRTLR
jgi:hypothetical protein